MDMIRVIYFNCRVKMLIKDMKFFFYGEIGFGFYSWVIDYF